MAERQILQNAVGISRIHLFRGAEIAAALRGLSGQQMASAGARAHDFAAARDLEPFGNRFLRLDTFGASHKLIRFLYKRARNIGCAGRRIKRYFLGFSRERRNFPLLAAIPAVRSVLILSRLTVPP